MNSRMVSRQTSTILSGNSVGNSISLACQNSFQCVFLWTVGYNATRTIEEKCTSVSKLSVRSTLLFRSCTSVSEVLTISLEASNGEAILSASGGGGLTSLPLESKSDLPDEESSDLASPLNEMFCGLTVGSSAKFVDFIASRKYMDSISEPIRGTLLSELVQMSDVPMSSPLRRYQAVN
ncbi:hypothetical protein M422DRAFT_40937 [Sphaerobolus stellatus SS14]|nr:hypothetical protein M422DRAFT_40937 [Sphaerobolus stellatus SS14]